MKNIPKRSFNCYCFQMDLNFTFSPSPNKRLRPSLVTDSPVRESPDKTRSAARDLLSGALKDAIKKEDDDELGSEIDLSSPMKRLTGSGRR